jgi:hypothetical protein
MKSSRSIIIVSRIIIRPSSRRRASAPLVLSQARDTLKDMNIDLSDLLARLPDFAQHSASEREQLLRASSALRQADDATVDSALVALAALSHEARQSALPLVTALIEHAAQRARSAAKGAARPALSPPARDAIAKLFNDLRAQPAAAWALVGILGGTRSREDLMLLAELLASAPPDDSPLLPQALGPLFQRDDYDATALYPRLLDALASPALAGAVLDLANYLTREHRVAEHPAKARASELVALLGGIVGRLASIEDAPDAGGRSPREVADIIAESLPLAVSLCDALAQIGDPSAIGKLHQAMELRHRRLRTEAAAALARLGDKRGADILVELAAEPVARLRVLAYAQELKLLDRIAAEHQTNAARAESELALWLSQPAQFGIPPTSLELFDEREQFWPSFDDKVECFLFRFQYDVGGGIYSNIGIAGPLEHAFQADLADLPPDDIYAAFAGWQAQHEELLEQDVASLNDAGRVEVSRLERRLRDQGFEAIAPQTLASFFGERVLVASATFERHPGVAVVTSGGEVSWFARGASSRPLGPVEAYCIFKGRRLLRTFNA